MNKKNSNMKYKLYIVYNIQDIIYIYTKYKYVKKNLSKISFIIFFTKNIYS